MKKVQLVRISHWSDSDETRLTASVMGTVVNAHAYGLPASTPSHARMRTLFSLPPAFHIKASQTE